MDFDDLDELTLLYNFTFVISGDCPNDRMNTDIKCSSEGMEIEDCVMCWRKALRERIDKLEG